MMAKTGLMRLFGAVALTLGAMATSAQGAASAVVPAGAAISSAFGLIAEADRLIFLNGRTVEGEILEESETQVRIMVDVAGIQAPMTYAKADLLKVEYGEKEEKPEPAQGGRDEPAMASDRPAPARSEDSGIQSQNVYVLNLKGVFARDITQTPIKDAVAEAERLNADYIIMKVNNDWTNPQNRLEELPDDIIGRFDGFFRTKEIAPLLREDLRKWSKPPKLVVWVETAMGGAAFLPFLSDTIYFKPEGRMGGVGGIFEMFGGQGDAGVVEKQISLRLVTAQGFAIQNGYEPKLVQAMTRTEYVLSYRMRGGKPEYFERMPENPGEILLTDDGTEDEFRDDVRDRVRGLGDDFLNLDADLAQRLGVSKGTVAEMDDLLFEIGLSRTANIVGNSDRIMEGWADGLQRVAREMRTMAEEYGEVQVGGDWDERRRGRGQKIRILEDIKRMFRRYKESLPGNYPFGVNMATEAYIDTLINQLKLEQLRDKK